METVKQNNNENTVIFTYTLGGDSYVEIPIKIAELTNGIHVHTNDNDEYLITAFSHYYFYYAFTQPQVQENKVILTSPYLSFYTQQIMITMSMPIYLQSKYFIGVASIDIPLSYLKHSIGDISVGPNSYWFVMNQQTEMILHPDIPDPDIPTNEYKPVYVNSVEPKEFNELILPAMMNRNKGYKQITAKIKQSAGDVAYNGFIDQTATLLYLYSPVGPTSLSIAVVMYTRAESTPPFVSAVSLESVPDKVCETDGNITKSMGACVSSFRLYNELDLMVQCDSSWVEDAGIVNSGIYGDRDIYGKKYISMKYPKYHLQPGLWQSESEAIYTDATCDELDALHDYTNILDKDLPYDVIKDELPYDGFRNDRMLRQIEIFTSFYQFWEPAWRSDESYYFMYFGTYEGFFTQYPAIESSKTYNPIHRPWYQRAISYPDLFVFTTPYASASTGRLTISGAKTIYVPDYVIAIGVAGFDIEYEYVFSENWKKIMGDICDTDKQQHCYLIDSSAFLLYFDGMENQIHDDDISTKFLGDKEPTLMQNLLERKLFEKNINANYESDEIDVTYIINEDVFNNGTFDVEPQGFEHNDGKYSIHYISGTNLYLIFIENYHKSRIYPWYCNTYIDTVFQECKDVEPPGCIIDVKSDICIPAFEDVCILPDLIHLEAVESAECDYEISDFGVCLLEDNQDSEMCASVWISNDACNNRAKEVIYIQRTGFWSAIAIICLIFIVLLISYIIKWKRKYDDKEDTTEQEEESLAIIKVNTYRGSLLDPDDFTATNRLDTTRTAYVSTIIEDDSSSSSPDSTTYTEYFKDETRTTEFTMTANR